MSRELGGLEVIALTHARSQPGRLLAAGSLVEASGWGPEQESKVLGRLARKGLLVRIRRGLYLAPADAAALGEMLALDSLMRGQEARWQISGPNAFQRYGWSEQVPNRLFVYNNRLSGERRAGPATLTLIKVPDRRLGGTETIRTPDGVDVPYASKARALMDAVYDWDRFDTLPRAFGWIKTEAGRDDVVTADLVQTAIEYGNQGTIRRIGAALERIGAQEGLLRKLERALRPSQSFIPWIPGRPKRGKGSKRWRVVYNDEQA